MTTNRDFVEGCLIARFNWYNITLASSCHSTDKCEASHPNHIYINHCRVVQNPTNLKNLSEIFDLKMAVRILITQETTLEGFSYFWKGKEN